MVNNFTSQTKIKMKIVIYLITFLFFTGSSFAQNYNAGIKGGLNLVNLSGDLEETSFKPAYHLGLFGHLMISEDYTLQPEIIYSKQGANNEDSDYSYALHYLNVPIIGKFYVSDRINLQIGPQIGFLLDSEFQNGIDIGLEDWTKGTSLAIGLGIGYDHEIFVFDIRYNMGLSNIFDPFELTLPNQTINLGEDFNVNNQVIQFSVGVKLLDKIL